MNASEKVLDFQRAAEKTGMQFGIASMDTLMRMRAGQFRLGVSSRCQMNYRNTVNQCGVSFPIYRKNAETLLCVVNRKKAERPEFSLLYLLCGASMLTIILSVRFRIFHSSLILAQKTTSANPFWGWRCGFFFGAHFCNAPGAGYLLQQPLSGWHLGLQSQPLGVNWAAGKGMRLNSSQGSSAQPGESQHSLVGML